MLMTYFINLIIKYYDQNFNSKFYQISIVLVRYDLKSNHYNTYEQNKQNTIVSLSLIFTKTWQSMLLFTCHYQHSPANVGIIIIKRSSNNNYIDIDFDRYDTILTLLYLHELKKEF